MVLGFLLTKFWSHDPFGNITEGPQDRTKWVLQSTPGSLSTAPPDSIIALDSKQHLLKIALFAWTFHWYIWFSFWKRPSNLIKLKSFESNHKFLIANLSKTPYTICVSVPPDPIPLFSSVFINLAGAKFTRINQFFKKIHFILIKIMGHFSALDLWFRIAAIYWALTMCQVLYVVSHLILQQSCKVGGIFPVVPMKKEKQKSKNMLVVLLLLGGGSSNSNLICQLQCLHLP